MWLLLLLLLFCKDKGGQCTYDNCGEAGSRKKSENWCICVAADVAQWQAEERAHFPFNFFFAVVAFGADSVG